MLFQSFRTTRVVIASTAILGLTAVFGCAGSKSGTTLNRSKPGHYVKTSGNRDLIALELNSYEETLSHNRNKKVEYKTRNNFDIPFVMNKKVEEWITIFTTTLRERFSIWLSRAGRYGPYMEHVLESYGVPKDLMYLSMIESGLSPGAYSSAQAAGLWQFIRSTGKLYGLSSTPWIDERFDIIKETHAGARHLKDLYSMYGNWYLAFAAYNAGAGKVNRAIVSTGSRDFWKISQSPSAIRQETKDYVPKILAAAYIAKNPEKFGLENVVKMEPLQFETIKVDGGLDLATAAQCAKTDLDWMKFMNAELKRGVTPPGETYELRIPTGSVTAFQTAYAQLTPEQKNRYAYGYDRTSQEDGTSGTHTLQGDLIGQTIANRSLHKVKRHETLAAIARRYHVSPKQLMIANNLKTTKIKLGQTIKIPGKASGSQVASLSPRPTSAVKAVIGKVLEPTAQAADITETVAPQKSSYTVKRGDTLAKIAVKHHVNIAQLNSWNPGLKKGHLIAGQKLALYLDTTSVTRLAATAEAATAPKKSQSTVAALAPSAAKATLSPAKKATLLAATPKAQKKKHRYYKVKEGDTLWQIAKRNAADMDDIKELNAKQLGKRNHLKAGMVLTIPPSTL